MKDFTGQVAVITGAASGIGLALARRFGKEGMRVVISDVEQQRLETAAEELRALGIDTRAVLADVSSLESVQALADKVRDEFGTWDLVCNNAGVQRRGTRVWEATDDMWNWILGVNLKGVINGLRVFLPDMISRDSGHVLNTGSMAGLMPAAGTAPYGVSKHGLVALSEATLFELREMGSKVNISLLIPGGAVRTGIIDAERNWPSDLARVEHTEQSAAYQERVAKMMAEEGRDPADIAEIAFAGVREEKFWIFAGERYFSRWLEHCESVAQGRDPEPFQW